MDVMIVATRNMRSMCMFAEKQMTGVDLSGRLEGKARQVHA